MVNIVPTSDPPQSSYTNYYFRVTLIFLLLSCLIIPIEFLTSHSLGNISFVDQTLHTVALAPFWFSTKDYYFLHMRYMDFYILHVRDSFYFLFWLTIPWKLKPMTSPQMSLIFPDFFEMCIFPLMR